MNKVLVLYSGGLDSTVLAYEAASVGYRVELISFYYGQCHSRELEAAKKIAQILAVPLGIVDIGAAGRLLNSSLTNSEIEATVVPNRNSIFANIAAGIAISREIDTIALAVHGGDYAVYPDCRPVFIYRLTECLRAATGTELQVWTPYLYLYKYQIVLEGYELNVPFELTWSCYKGGEIHCGNCGACVERREAFELAGVEDPTEYES